MLAMTISGVLADVRINGKRRSDRAAARRMCWFMEHWQRRLTDGLQRLREDLQLPRRRRESVAAIFEVGGLKRKAYPSWR